jgi:hypothetical protein
MVTGDPVPPRSPSHALNDREEQEITIQVGHTKHDEVRGVPMKQILTEILKSVKLATSQADRMVWNHDQTSSRALGTAFEHAVCKAGMTDSTFPDRCRTSARRLTTAGTEFKHQIREKPTPP